MMDVLPNTILGEVASLHLHPAKSGGVLLSVAVAEAAANKGLAGDARYFGRLSRNTGEPTSRQVSLIAREQIQEHASALGLREIPPGAVRSNIETRGVSWERLLGRRVRAGQALLLVHSLREPCSQMDAICQGLRERMLDGLQGVLATVVESGPVRVGDKITLV